MDEVAIDSDWSDGQNGSLWLPYWRSEGNEVVFGGVQSGWQWSE